MTTNSYRKLLFGIATGVATFVTLGTTHAQEVAAQRPAVPVHTMTYRTDSQIPMQDVRWGRGYYGGPYGYYGAGPRGYYAPRYYSGYRGYGYRGYGDAPYGGYYPGNYYGARYGYGPGYGNYYGGGGVRVGRVGIVWR